MNLTSTEALARIGKSINERYRWLASSIGFNTIERSVATAATVAGSQYATFGLLPIAPGTPITVQKLLSVYNTALTPPQVLDEVTFDTLRNSVPLTGNLPRRYAISLMGSSTCQVFLDSIASSIYTLTADVMTNLTTLSGTNVPAFATDYHNALVYGAMATELDKMEKYDLSKKKEAQWDERVSELRMFIAKSAYLDIYPARRKNNLSNWTPLI